MHARLDIMYRFAPSQYLRPFSFTYVNLHARAPGHHVSFRAVSVTPSVFATTRRSQIRALYVRLRDRSTFLFRRRAARLNHFLQHGQACALGRLILAHGGER